MEQGKSVRSPTPNEEVAEKMDEEQNATPIPSPFALFWRSTTRDKE